MWGRDVEGERCEGGEGEGRRRVEEGGRYGGRGCRREVVRDWEESRECKAVGCGVGRRGGCCECLAVRRGSRWAWVEDEARSMRVWSAR